MPGSSLIVDYLWKLVRENPDVIPQLVRMAKDRFGSTEAPQAAPPPPGPSLERLDQLESDLASAGRLIGALEARIDAQAQQLSRAEAEIARLSAANTQVARRLRTAVIATAAAMSLAFALLIYILIRP